MYMYTYKNNNFNNKDIIIAVLCRTFTTVARVLHNMVFFNIHVIITNSCINTCMFEGVAGMHSWWVVSRCGYSLAKMAVFN